MQILWIILSSAMFAAIFTIGGFFAKGNGGHRSEVQAKKDRATALNVFLGLTILMTVIWFIGTNNLNSSGP